MNEQLMQTIKDLEIKKAPEAPSLEAANDCYTKVQLAHFIERHDLSIAKSWKKAEIVTALSEWMEKASTELLESNADLHSFYSEDVVKASSPFSIYEDNRSETELEHVLLLIEHGLAYNVDGQLWMPEETQIADVEKDTSSDEQDERPTSKKEAPKKTSAPNKQVKQTARPSTRPVSAEERLSNEKQVRLEYLKTQAKKKKRKKRK